ncbi:HlyD family secretion protein, partial [Roseomonas chloroacetimidivorans]|uniref:HlyD family secretion protein n=1 Tax=Roseomonas chloroacetimidivorans TaxID=1766656 RepID=UPI003C791FF9
RSSSSIPARRMSAPADGPPVSEHDPVNLDEAPAQEPVRRRAEEQDRASPPANERSDAKGRDQEQKQKPRRNRWRWPLMLGGLVLVAGGSLYWWLTGGRYVSEEDAYVQADKLMLSLDVSGVVQEIPVHEGEDVKQGQILFRLDPASFQFALDGAKAQLEQTRLAIDAMKADYQRILRETAAQQAQVQLAQVENDRYAQAVRSNSVSRSDYDRARFRLQQAQAQLEALRQQAQVQLAKLNGQAEIPTDQHPDYMSAKARVDEAQRQLDHTVLRAPFAGVVTQVASLQPGQYLTASTPAFGLVSSEHVWVDAFPKETALTYAKLGDPVTVTVDTYPDRVWHGRLQSIAPVSGSQFSVLPAQNTSGNWVKVVQRIPARIQVDREPGDPPLRAGMSVVISIDTGHQRHLSDLF